MKTKYKFIIGLSLILFEIKSTKAVPPPDFLFQVGSQIAQIFTIIVLFLSAFFGSMFRFMKVYIQNMKHKKLFWILLIASILLVSFVTAYFYDQYQQKKAYEQWINQSNNQESVLPDQPEGSIVQNDTAEVHKDVTAENLKPLAISNDEFKKVMQTEKNVFILDAREDEEFAIGHFPESVHIRFADLKEGEWQKLPDDATIYVFCWSGIRGKEVAEFLRSKQKIARYLEKGAEDFVKSGGKWEGEINFSSVYKADQYRLTFELNKLQEHIQKGAVLIDSRPQAKYEKKHIPGSINIPIIYTPSKDIENKLAQIPESKPIISICDDFVSCFDAKIIGVKLEKRGHQFLGRYNKPWEYPQKPQ